MTTRRSWASGARGRRTLGFAAVASLVWAAGAAVISLSHGWGGNQLLELLSGLAFLWAGLFALANRPGNTIGALLLAYGFLWFLPYWATYAPPVVDATLTVVTAAADALLVHIAVIFPTGRAAGAFGRVVIVIAYTWELASSFALEATIDRSMWPCDVSFCRPTLSEWLWPDQAANQLIGAAGDWATLVVLGLTVAAIAQRQRRATRVQSHALRPLWLAVGILAAAYLVEAVSSLTATPMPSNAAAFELRALAQLAAPLLIVHGLVRARWTTAAVDSLLPGVAHGDRNALQGALAQTLEDPSLQLLSSGPDGWRSVDGTLVVPPTDPAAVEYVNDAAGRPRAALVHDRGLAQSAVTAAAAVTGLLLENDALARTVADQLVEVRASRARIVEAGYRERRRVERDLHDGAQQRLLSVALALRIAQREVDTSSGSASTTLAAAATELRSAIAELRELARGIHPSILTDAGLGPAVTALAERCPVAVAELQLPERRFPTEIETTAYFVVAEALTNVVRHAGATAVAIRVVADETSVRVSIEDDGVGGANPASGTGLHGLQDRVDAVGGTFTVSSPGDGGTKVEATLPLSGAPS